MLSGITVLLAAPPPLPQALKASKKDVAHALHFSGTEKAHSL